MANKKVALQKFEGMQTEWMGVWRNEGYNGYMSQTFSLDVFKQFKGNVKFYLRKNRYYKKDSSRPYFVLCVKECKSPVFNELKVKSDESYARIGHDDDEIVTGMVFSYSDIQNLINKVAYAAGGDSEYVVSDFMSWTDSDFIAIPGTY